MDGRLDHVPVAGVYASGRRVVMAGHCSLHARHWVDGSRNPPTALSLAQSPWLVHDMARAPRRSSAAAAATPAHRLQPGARAAYRCSASASAAQITQPPPPTHIHTKAPIHRCTVVRPHQRSAQTASNATLVGAANARQRLCHSTALASRSSGGVMAAANTCQLPTQQNGRELQHPSIT